MFGKKKTEVEFTGVSVSNEKRNAIVLFVMEAIVVLIFIAGVLFALNYFGIFPLNKITPFFNSLPTRGIQNNIEITSDIPGYKVVFANKNALINYLDDANIFNKTYDSESNFFLKGGMNSEPLKVVHINVTSDAQNGNAYSDGSETFSSVGITLSPRRADIFVQIGNSLLEKGNFSDINAFLQEQIVVAIYVLLNDIKTVPELNNEKNKIYEIVREQIRSEMIFLQLESKKN